MGKTGEQLVVIAMALIGLATVAVLVSNNANTSTVLSKGFSGFASAISAAIAPITGGTGGSVL